MADQRFKVLDADGTPQYVDNSLVINDQEEEALRQNIGTPDAAQLLAEAVALLQALVCKKGQREPVSGADRCSIVGGTINVVTTVSTVTTCTTVTTVTTCASVTAVQNIVNVGGQPASNDYLIANRLLALQQLHFGVTVT